MITIEISSTDIKLMETEGRKVVKWASLPLEPGVVEEGVVTNPPAFSATIKQLMTSSGIKGSSVTASVSGLYSLSRIVMVPTPPGEPVTQMAVLEAASAVMPLSEDELYVSWQIIATGEGGQQVLVVGVPRDVIDSEVQALRVAGVNPRLLDLKAMALIRAVNREQALILNIEPTSFDTVLVVNGVAEIMRTTAWQPDDLAVEEQVEHLAVALELTAGFYNSHHPGSPLDPATPLFITGQMSGDLALIEKLRDRVDYSLATLAPSLEYPAHLPVSQYAVNIGLALKGTAAPESPGQSGYSLSDINLLPRTYQPWRPSARQIYLSLAVIAIIALLFPLYQVTTEAMGKTANLQTKYDTLNRELEKRKVEISKREPLQMAINQYNTIVDLGGGFIEDLRVIKSKAEELGIKVESINHGGNSITFSCQANSYLIFRNYLTALKESGRFSLVSSPAERFPYLTGGAISITLKR